MFVRTFIASVLLLSLIGCSHRNYHRGHGEKCGHGCCAKEQGCCAKEQGECPHAKKKDGKDCAADSCGAKSCGAGSCGASKDGKGAGGK